MLWKTTPRLSTINSVYLIVSLFISLFFILILLVHVQMNALIAVRAYVGAEGLWAKAQKDATRSLEHYALSRDESDYQSYLHFIQVPLGDLKARVELQKNNPNLDIARNGFIEGGNTPEDIEYMIDLFLRFQHVSFMAEAIEHWTKADQFIAELNGEAKTLHDGVSSGVKNPESINSLLARLNTINQHVTERENKFSATLANASRWATDISREATYFIALLFTLLGLSISWRIVSRIRTVEGRLHELSNLQQAILAGANYAIIATDTNGLITSFNRTAERMLGYQIDEVVGKQTPAIFHDPLEVAAHAEELTKELGRLVSPGFEVFVAKAMPGQPVEREWTYVHKNGTRFPVMISVTALLNENNIAIGYLGIANNITERKNAELALQQHKVAIETTHEGFWLVGSDGRILEANQAYADMSGYSIDELRGMHISSVEVRERSPEDVKSHIDKIKQQGWDVFETRHHRKDGKTIEVEVSTTFIRESQQIVAFFRDISERKALEKEMRIAATAFDTHESIMITDVDGNIIRVNHAFEKVTGFYSEEVIGKNPRILSSGRHDKAFYADMWGQLLGVGTWTGEMWDKRKNGQIYPKWLTITAVRDNKGNTTEYVAIFSDITARKKAEEEIYSLAFYDVLTKLPNRRLLLDRIHQAQLISDRSSQYGALLFLDMDRFKSLNDTLGHDYGDMFLVEISQRLQHCVREADTVARIGGDEFVVLMEEIGAGAEDVSQKVALVAEKIRSALSTPYQLKEHEHHSSPSIGVTLYRGHDESVEVLLKHADMAMYQAKDSGRNAVRFFDPTMQLAVETRAALEADLRYAVPGNQLRLYYQVQLDSELRPLGAEALIRWFHPLRGMVSPLQFIPIAEESSLILDIGNWVLKTACKQLALWSKNEKSSNLTLAVNVSAPQFQRHDFVENLATLIHLHHANPNRLKLELTESVVLNDVKDVVTKMHALKALGVRLSLDDFGTGYSSLSYLKQLPLDQIKIDQTFVRDVLIDSNDAVMVQTIIGLAQNFRMNVIAEGVETEAQLNFLKQNGCLAYQGYLFSKPVPIDEFERLLSKDRFLPREM